MLQIVKLENARIVAEHHAILQVSFRHSRRSRLAGLKFSRIYLVSSSVWAKKTLTCDPAGSTSRMPEVQADSNTPFFPLFCLIDGSSRILVWAHQAGLEFTILLAQATEFWGCRLLLWPGCYSLISSLFLFAKGWFGLAAPWCLMLYS